MHNVKPDKQHEAIITNMDIVSPIITKVKLYQPKIIKK